MKNPVMVAPFIWLFLTPTHGGCRHYLYIGSFLDLARSVGDNPKMEEFPWLLGLAWLGLCWLPRGRRQGQAGSVLVLGREWEMGMKRSGLQHEEIGPGN
jgi:hypothetical protein